MLPRIARGGPALIDPLLTAIGALAEALAESLVIEPLVHAGRRRRGKGRGAEVSPAQVRQILKGTAQRLGDALGDELAGTPEHEWRAAAVVARDSFAAVVPLHVERALDLELRPDRLERYVR